MPLGKTACECIDIGYFVTLNDKTLTQLVEDMSASNPYEVPSALKACVINVCLSQLFINSINKDRNEKNTYSAMIRGLFTRSTAYRKVA